jgi:uncharacterized protein YegL
MNKNLTDLTLIVDKSGSMYSVKGKAEAGINGLIADQKGEDTDCTFTLVEFSDKHNTVQNAVPISRARRYTLNAGGGTALLDAVGDTINKIGARLRKLPESERPGLVMVAIVTDGQEWASKEYTKAQIKTMISHQTSAYDWQFTFLGADANAFADASAIGIKTAASYSASNTDHAFGSVSSNVSRMRGATSGGLKIDNSYTGDEIRSMSE